MHYERCPATRPVALVRAWAQLYKARGWERFGAFDARGTIGYAYCFPKAKNVSRNRVIVSCVRHPMRRALHRAGRILVRLLCKCAFANYNLYSVAEFMKRLEAYSKRIASSDMLLAVCTDVKEMYTGMRHTETLAAVAFMLERCRAALRSPYVSVSKYASGPVFVGRSHARDFVAFHLDDLLPLVRFELKNLYFTLGSEAVLHQVIGAAMGGFTSPACAQCVAAVAEYTCMCSFLRSGCLFAARFMDDTLTIFNLSVFVHTCSSLRAALHSCFHMYDFAGLEVELEAAGLTASMLSSTVSLHPRLACTFWNKNQAFPTSGVQRVRRLLPCLAQSPAAQRAVFSGLLHRVATATTPACIPSLLPRLLELRCEASSLGYSPVQFDRAVRNYAYSRLYSVTFAAWRLLLRTYMGTATPSAGPAGAAYPLGL